MVKMNGLRRRPQRPSVSLFGSQGGGCRQFPLENDACYYGEAENSKHSRCMYTLRFSILQARHGDTHLREFLLGSTQTLEQFHRNSLHITGADIEKNYLFLGKIDLLNSISKNDFASVKFIITYSRALRASRVSGNSFISLSAS